MKQKNRKPHIPRATTDRKARRVEQRCCYLLRCSSGGDPMHRYWLLPFRSVSRTETLRAQRRVQFAIASRYSICMYALLQQHRRQVLHTRQQQIFDFGVGWRWIISSTRQLSQIGKCHLHREFRFEHRLSHLSSFDPWCPSPGGHVTLLIILRVLVRSSSCRD